MIAERELYNTISFKSSKVITKEYSTSFSLGIRMLCKSIRQDIYNIYGFVRVADEIVDTYYDKDAATVLADFKVETYKAIKLGYSPNPILHSLQYSVNKYGIDLDLIEAFLYSMEMDLHSEKNYDQDLYEKYIYGSAEVVGLMCLKVFCDGNQEQYESLVDSARALGSAFQKINFLRDIKNDKEELGRFYFPGWEGGRLSQDQKLAIEADIRSEFDHALEGIKRLPPKAKFGVYAAYVYYRDLLKKISEKEPDHLLENRVRIPNWKKMNLLLWANVKYRLRRI